MEKLNVIYDDNHVVVAIKPHNVPCAPDESGDEDMLSLVKAFIKEKYDKKGEAFAGLVHRLDRPTGGIMVFARNSKSAARLSSQFKTHDVEKVYYAVLQGEMKERSGRLTHYLKKNERENIVKIVPMGESGAKKAELEFKVLGTAKGRTLVEVRLLTGRSHQIRVQFASVGFPLVGDVKYGKSAGRTKNLGLWAGRLSFNHPTTGERLTFFACPDDSVEPWKGFDLEKHILKR